MAVIRASTCSGMVAAMGPQGATGPITTGIVPRGADGDHGPASLDLGDVGGQLGIPVVDDDNGRARFDQGQRSMLEFAGRVVFGPP